MCASSQSPDVTIEIPPALVRQPNNPRPLVFPRMQLFQRLLPLGNDITDLAKGKQVCVTFDNIHALILSLAQSNKLYEPYKGNLMNIIH